MSVSKDKRTGNWQYEFMYKGVRYHRNFKNASKAEVEGFEAIAKANLIQRGYDIAKNINYSLSEIVTDYKLYIDNNYSRPAEAKFVVDKFYNLIGNKPAEDITVQDLEKYRGSRKGKIKNSSINREMDNIKRLFSLAKENKKIKINPCEDLKKLKIENPRKRYLTKEEEEKLLQVANPTLKAVIIVALHTGMRLSEITHLKWGDIFFKENYLIALNTKNGKSRELIITKQMRQELESLPRLSEYVFTNPVTKRPYKDFKSSFKRAVQKAGIPYITFHELRHSTASRLNELGVDLATIQEYLDHADARTTQRYIHKPKKNIIAAINKLEEY